MVRNFEKHYAQQTGWNLRDCLKEMFCQRRLSTTAIAKELGISQSAVVKYIHKYELEQKPEHPPIVLDTWLTRPLVPDVNEFNVMRRNA